MALYSMAERLGVSKYFQESPQQKEVRIAQLFQKQMDLAVLAKWTFFRQMSRSTYYSRETHHQTVEHALANGWTFKVRIGHEWQVLDLAKIKLFQLKDEGVYIEMKKKELGDEKWISDYLQPPDDVNLVKT